MNLLILVLVAVMVPVSGWNPDAGPVVSWTKTPGVTVTATSNAHDASLALDNNDNTQWTSRNCLPGGYLNRSDVNTLMGLCRTSACQVSGTHSSEQQYITDGDLYTAGRIGVGADNVAKLTLQTNGAEFINISVWGMYGDRTTLKAIDREGNEIILRTFDSGDNYHEVPIAIGTSINHLEFMSSSQFTIKEISGLGPKGCHERITLDLGTPREIGRVRTRHWVGKNVASNITLLLSVDGQRWDTIGSLQPEALGAVITTLDHPTSYRYIAIDYDLILRKYNHVYCWEIDAFDRFGVWGPAPVAKPNRVHLRKMLGVNGIWGWGHKKYSSMLQNGEGPTLYNKIASHARNYHNLNWDVQDPDFDPQFEKMGRGGGTNASWWLNWDTEYAAWFSANLQVDASIQFTNKTTRGNWNDPKHSAYNYGKEFAEYFGPTIGNGYVSALEVGNEPWDYNADFYATVLEAMAAGVRSVDHQMDVLPGAFQADKISSDEPTKGNYIGNRVKSTVLANISVINTHAYSYIINDNGIRKATFPENPESTFNSIRNIIRWRDTNAPDKPIWLTEWGWDADGRNEDCAATECVTKLAQAIYGVRGLFIVARLGIERATWYFYANTDCNTLYCRSGLTTSATHNFTKKSVFHTFESVLKRIGSRHFISIIQEDDSGYVYTFGTSTESGTPVITHVVGWLPVDAEAVTSKSRAVKVPDGMIPRSAWRLTGIPPYIVADTPPISDGRTMTLILSPKPSIIELDELPPPVVG